MARRVRRVTDIFKDCQLYLMERGRKLDQEKVFKTRAKPVREYLEKQGTEDPDTGNLVYEFPAPVSNGDGVIYSGVELRKSVGPAYFELDEVKDFLYDIKVNESGRSFSEIGAAKKEILNRVVKTRTEEYLDTDELYAIYQEGQVTEPQLRGLMHYPKPTYALWPIEEKEVLDEE